MTKKRVGAKPGNTHAKKEEDNRTIMRKFSVPRSIRDSVWAFAYPNGLTPADVVAYVIHEEYEKQKNGDSGIFQPPVVETDNVKMYARLSPVTFEKLEAIQEQTYLAHGQILPILLQQYLLDRMTHPSFGTASEEPASCPGLAPRSPQG